MRFQVYTSQPHPRHPLGKAGGKAAPATPQGTATTNTKSSTMFSTALTPKNTKGAAEFPTARSRLAK